MTGVRIILMQAALFYNFNFISDLYLESWSRNGLIFFKGIEKCLSPKQSSEWLLFELFLFFVIFVVFLFASNLGICQKIVDFLIQFIFINGSIDRFLVIITFGNLLCLYFYWDYFEIFFKILIFIFLPQETITFSYYFLRSVYQDNYKE